MKRTGNFNMKRVTIFKKLIVAIALLFTGFAAAAQVSFSVDAPRVVGLDESFRIVFISNAEPSSFDPPSMQGFDILAGPTSSRMSSTQIINGKKSESFEVSYTYVVQPKSIGKFSVSSATAVINGKRYSTQPLTIEVVKGDASNNASSGSNRASGSQTAAEVVSGNDIFMRMSVSKGHVVKGEPLIATLKLYTKVPISGFENVKFPSFNGFWSQEIETPQNIEFVRENVGGVIYNAALLRRYMLMPQQTGSISIDPSEMICQVQVKSAQSSSGRSVFDDFFSDYQTVKKRITAPGIRVIVDPLPSGAPASFTGGVGEFRMEAKFNRDSVNANEAVSLTITISGSGNINLIESPKVDFPVDFEKYDVKILDKSNKTGSSASGSKVFEYPIIPRGAGAFSVPSVDFTYYDIKKHKYITLSSGELKLKVGRDTGGGSATYGSSLPAGVNKQAVRSLSDDVRYIKTGASGLRKGDSMMFGSVVYIALIALIIAFYFVALRILSKRIKMNRDVAGVKNRRANKVAKARLKAAEGLMKQSLNSAFYEELHRALLGYASDKLTLALSDLSREKIRESLFAKNVKEELTDEFISLIDACEYARYAPDGGGVEMHSNYQRAIKLISTLES